MFHLTGATLTLLVIIKVCCQSLPDACNRRSVEDCHVDLEKTAESQTIGWFYDGSICYPGLLSGCSNMTYFDTKADCEKECPEYFYEDASGSSDWPAGPYAIPMSVYGCPGDSDKGWRHGYINMTFKSKLSEDRDVLTRAQKSRLLGPFSDSVVQMNFCLKLEPDSNERHTAVSWFEGNYSIYRAHAQCPFGFDAANLTFRFPPLLHKNIDGYLPDYTLVEETLFTELTIQTCSRNDNFPVLTNTGVWNYPFILLQTAGTEVCPLVPGLSGTDESSSLLRTLLTTKCGEEECGDTSDLKYCVYVNRDTLTSSVPAGVFRPLFIPQEETVAEIYGGNFDMSWCLFRTNGIQLHPLPVYTVAEDSPSWILVDLEQIINVRHVLIYYDIKDEQWDIDFNGTSYFNNYTPGAPCSFSTTYSGNSSFQTRLTMGIDKWSLLSNGGTRCNAEPVQIEKLPYILLSCERPMRARYIHLDVREDGSDKTIATRKIQKIFVTGEETGCGKDLGMQDFAISDFQISASTETEGHPARFSRPGFKGWCADTNDTSPYLQITFLVNVTLEGIRIYNWVVTQSYNIENVYRKEYQPMGIQSFTLEYGFSVNALEAYTLEDGNVKTFVLDKSQPYDSTQTFSLLNPVTTSIIRIHATSISGPASPPCMKAELIGCRKNSIKTIQCSNSTSSVMVGGDTAFVPAESFDEPVVFAANSSRGCSDVSQSELACVAVTFDGDQCKMYTALVTNNFLPLETASNSFVLQKLCIDEQKVSHPVEFGELDWMFETTKSVTTVTEPGVITSAGYPLGYNTGLTEKWIIKLKSDIRLFFTNISLNEYEKEYDTEQTGRRCNDRIIIHEPYSSQAYFEKLFPGFVYKTSDGFDRVVLNSSHNNQQPLIRTTFPQLHLIFYSCYRQDNITRQGRGFRAIVEMGDGKHFCKSAVSSCTIREPTKDVPFHLISQFFNGQNLYRDREFWYIVKGQSAGPGGIGFLVISFTDFDIPCGQGSSLIIQLFDLQYGREEFCNFKRPIGDIKTTSSTCIINVTYQTGQPFPDDLRVVGFRAVYRVGRMSSYITNAPVNIIRTGYKDRDRLYIHLEVCSNELGKCYRFMEHEELITSWQAQKFCFSTDNSNQKILQIQTKDENDFITYQLLYRTDIFVPVHIGFYNDGKERWHDGSPVTFTAWKHGKQADRKNKRCALLYRYLLVDKSWTSVNCDEPSAAAFVCEYSTALETTRNIHSFIVENETLSLEQPKHKLFQCSSRVFISRLHVCDGIKDCNDGTDEMDCKVQESNCPSGYFGCHDGGCVPVSTCCDFVADCKDGSDEFCDLPRCSLDEFSCSNGQCIPLKQHCDLHQDCWDGSDEINCVFCNGDTFQCSIGLGCIPQSRLCDGFPDCPDGQDESKCTSAEESLTSCKDAWKMGYRTTGKYTLGDDDVLCNFDNIYTRGVITTEYYDVDIIFQYSNGSVGSVMYNSIDFVSTLFNNNSVCTISITQTCRPPKDDLGNISASEGFHCPISQASYIWDRGSQRYQNHSDIEFLEALHLPHRFRVHVDKSEHRYKVGPLTCEEEFSPLNDTVVCDKGYVVPEKHKCLYDIDVDGIVKGCREFAHLQNCELATCPTGYIKCPETYCIPIHYVCDGVKDCPNGDDEIQCYTIGKDPHDIIFLIDGSDSIRNEDFVLLKTFLADVIDTFEIGPELVNIGVIVFSTFIGDVISLQPYKDKIIIKSSARTLTKPSFGTDTGRALKTAQQMFEEQGRLDARKTMILITDGRSAYPPETLMQAFSAKSQNVTIAAIGVGTDIYREELYQIASSPKHVILVDDYRWLGIEVNALLETIHRSAVNTITDRSSPLSSNLTMVSQDEAEPVCPGFYRCHGSKMCLHPMSLCDGIRQCPTGDDERLCYFTCTDKCSCDGFTVNCSNYRANVDSLRALSPSTRSLDLSKNSLTVNLTVDKELLFLVILNISRCQLSGIPRRFIQSMRNLLTLDLSFNKIKILRKGDFINKDKLLYLDLNGNHELAEIEPYSLSDLKSLRMFSVTHAALNHLQANTFASLNLTKLTLSYNRMREVDDFAFNGSVVSEIDLRNNYISKFKKNMFYGSDGLIMLFTDAFKFCCVKPDTVTQENCLPHRDEFSSCEDMMREEALRFLLWVIGIFALVGNVLSLIYRMALDRKRLKLGYGVFVTNLAIADCLMGIYLLIIAVADLTFRGQYITWDDWWRNSMWCSMAGVISSVSSEASVLFICLITFDRILVIKYPFGDLRFKSKNAFAFSLCVWIIVIIVSTAPLGFKSGGFYSRSAVCLALPLTRDRPPGWVYSTVVFVGFNFVAFVLIAAGQCLIFREIRLVSNLNKSIMSGRRNDLIVAKNLLLVVTTDFMCWFPIGIMGLCALNGYAISGDVYAYAAVLILPVNSALNPFLYTFSALVRRKRFEPRMDEQLEQASVSKETVKEIIDVLMSHLTGPKLSGDESCIPLSSHIAEASLTDDDVSRRITQLSDVMETLHKTGLIVGKLDLDDIHVIVRNNIVHKIALSATPSLSSHDTQKTQDLQNLEELGKDLRRRFKAVDDQSSDLINES